MRTNYYFKSLPLNKQKSLVEEVIERCCKAWNVEKPQDIQELDISAQNVYSWKQGPSMPHDFIMHTAVTKDVDIGYLYFGTTNISKVDSDTIKAKIANVLEQTVQFGMIKSEEVKFMQTRFENEFGISDNTDEKKVS